MASEPIPAPDVDEPAAPAVPPRPTRAQRWLARLALLLAAAAVLVLPVVAGRRGIVMVVLGVAGLAASAAGIWWALTHRGTLRLLAVSLAVAAPLAVLGLYLAAGLAWLALLAPVLWGAGVLAGRAALTRDPGPGRMPEHPASPPAQPFVIMNPRSGGGKVARFDLDARARTLGAEVFLLDGPEPVDVAEVARAAVARGADLLGVAGGDGTQALVAGVAAERGVPLMVISAGTRNHFALDLGLDREDPSNCLDALADGVDLEVDLGVVAGRPFVNNASFGAYAAVVQSPAYRDDKRGTTLELLPDLLVGHQGAHLRVEAGAVTVDGPQAVLVSNNPYGMGDVAGMGRRARLDGGVLGVVGVRVRGAAEAAGLLRLRHRQGLTVTTASRVTVDADADAIPVGVDGEALLLSTPVVCELRPAALRVRVPRDRPGVPLPKPTTDWRRLSRMALTAG